MKEKELIDKFFIPFYNLDLPNDIKKAAGDDAAVLSVGGKNLAVSVDTMSKDTHFYADIAPYDLGFRSVGAALSDMAAMSATPKYVTLSLSLQRIETPWIEKFLGGVKACLDEFDCHLVGGDTVKGSLSVSVQVIGICEFKPIYRNSAEENDLVAVSGSLGAAKTALQFLDKNSSKNADIDHVLARYHRPSPRIALAKELAKYMTSAIDISDGLFSDIGQIACQSMKQITLFKQDIPIDPIILKLINEKEAILNALAGGDDYEVAFTFNRKYSKKIANIGKSLNIPITVIGTVEKGRGVRVLDERGVPIDESLIKGFDHF